MVLLQGYGTAAAESSRSGAGKIFPAHYKECRLGFSTELIRCHHRAGMSRSFSVISHAKAKVRHVIECT